MDKPHEQPLPEDQYLSYQEASRLLSVRTGTLYSWVSRKVIPYTRVGPRVVRFRRSDLEAWLNGRSVKPAETGGR